MKRFYFASALLVLLLLLSLLNAYASQQLADDLSFQLEQAQHLAQADRWAQASALTRQVYENWQAHHAYLHIFLQHADTDEIQRGFCAVQEYLALQEMDQYAAANADLIAQIRLLAEMEQATLVNVL